MIINLSYMSRDDTSSRYVARIRDLLCYKNIIGISRDYIQVNYIELTNPPILPSKSTPVILYHMQTNKHADLNSEYFRD